MEVGSTWGGTQQVHQRCSPSGSPSPGHAGICSFLLVSPPLHRFSRTPGWLAMGSVGLHSPAPACSPLLTKPWFLACEVTGASGSVVTWACRTYSSVSVTRLAGPCILYATAATRILPQDSPTRSSMTCSLTHLSACRANASFVGAPAEPPGARTKLEKSCQVSDNCRTCTPPWAKVNPREPGSQFFLSNLAHHTLPVHLSQPASQVLEESIQCASALPCPQAVVGRGPGR